MSARRGLTLIELLASLTLVALLTAALAAWTQTTARAAVGADHRLPWLSSAHATLNRIAEDLLVGDFELPKPQSAPSPPSGSTRIRSQDGRLVIKTRNSAPGVAPGSEIHEYFKSPESDRLLIQKTRESGEANTHSLMTGLAEWTVALDEQRHVLTVSLKSTDGQSLSRRYIVP